MSAPSQAVDARPGIPFEGRCDLDRLTAMVRVALDRPTLEAIVGQGAAARHWVVAEAGAEPSGLSAKPCVPVSLDAEGAPSVASPPHLGAIAAAGVARANSELLSLHRALRETPHHPAESWSAVDALRRATVVVGLLDDDRLALLADGVGGPRVPAGGGIVASNPRAPTGELASLLPADHDLSTHLVDLTFARGGDVVTRPVVVLVDHYAGREGDGPTVAFLDPARPGGPFETRNESLASLNHVLPQPWTGREPDRAALLTLVDTAGRTPGGFRAVPLWLTRQELDVVSGASDGRSLPPGHAADLRLVASAVRQPAYEANRPTGGIRPGAEGAAHLAGHFGGGRLRALHLDPDRLLQLSDAGGEGVADAFLRLAGRNGRRVTEREAAARAASRTGERPDAPGMGL